MPILLIIVLAVVALRYKSNLFGREAQDGSYYAVFLNNDQAYFGRIEKTDIEIIMSDVHYLSSGSQASSTSPQLFRLKDQMHRPEGSLNIPIQNVAFYEKLSEESPIVKSIKSN
jgi:hypothetical protein